MSKHPFTYYLHDDYSAVERAQFISEQLPINLTLRDAERMESPFYEVPLNCEYDTETGLVTILGVGP